MGLNVGLRFNTSPASNNRRTASTAMAGEPAKPGLSIPATLMNRGWTSDASMIQSPRSLLALAPQKAYSPTLFCYVPTTARDAAPVGLHRLLDRLGTYMPPLGSDERVDEFVWYIHTYIYPFHTCIHTYIHTCI